MRYTCIADSSFGRIALSQRSYSMNYFEGVLVLLLGLQTTELSQQPQDKSATPAEQFKVLVDQFSYAARVSYLDGKTDEERNRAIERIVELSPRFLELAENYPTDPI